MQTGFGAAFEAAYDLGTLIHAGPRSRVFRARRRADDLAVVVKLAVGPIPPDQAALRLQRELELGLGVEHPHVARYLGFERIGEAGAVIVADVGGSSLADRIPAGGMAVERAVLMSLQLAHALAAVHAAGVVHRDVNPGNLLVDPSGERLTLVDFAVATRLDDDERLHVAPDRIEGTLAYISPEQTGRMSRSLDHRADLYSVGVTLYELLCGQLPFTATEPLELIHCHLAKLPEPPIKLRPDLPEQLSRVVMKLLAKAPEDRYPSARALAADLRRCQQALLAGRSPALFELATDERRAELRVPSRLFGRERDLDLLDRAWQRASGGEPGLVVVSGSSGVGKSALVAELERRVADRAGAFIRGKFTQLGGPAAYEGFAEALRSLAGRLLGASMDEFERWSARLAEALDLHGRLLLDVVPELELVVGPLASVDGLGPDEAQHRLQGVLRRFLRACGRPGQPLTLFLDDLQWADAGSLALLEHLAADRELGHLLLIVSVRDDELDAQHPTQQCLEQLRAAALTPSELRLAALGVADVDALIGEALGRVRADPNEPLDDPATCELAELVVERTAGNPLFVRTFLQTAWDERLLTAELDPATVEPTAHVAWRWDAAGLRQMQASESVGELLARRLRQLPGSTRALLQTAACFGTSFTPETVAAITGTDLDATLADLRVAAEAGMILLRSDERWDFVHDRVREAAHASLPAAERAEAHLRIGELLLATTPADRLTERIFVIVDHLDAGRALLRDREQRLGFARLAERAGQRAQRSTAYPAAVRYFRGALDCLARLEPDPDAVDPSLRRAWAEHHALTLGLHRDLAVAEYLADDAGASLERITGALPHARDAADRVELFELLVFRHTIATRYAQALAIAREALAWVGIDLPRERGAIASAIATAEAELRERLGGRSITTLVELPAMTGRETRAAARLLATSVSAAYSAEPTLFPLVALALVNLSLAHGCAPESSYGFAAYGAFLGAARSDPASASAWGELALALALRDDDTAQQARVCNVVAGFILPWSEHVRTCEAVQARGLAAAIASGQRSFIGYISYHRLLHHAFAGSPLDRLEHELAAALPQLRAINHTYAADVVHGLQLATAGLRGDGSTGPEQTRDRLAEYRARHSNVAVCAHHIYRGLTALVLDDPTAALANAEAAAARIDDALGHVAVADQALVEVLALAASFDQRDESARTRALARMAELGQRLGTWAQRCPANFEARARLAAAELARCRGDLLAAVDQYEQAITAATSDGFVHLQAIASELAARVWLRQGNRRLAQPYLAAALAGYRSWGAEAKLRRLAAELPELVSAGVASEPRRRIVDPIPSAGSSQALDLATVTRASQAISSEIDLDRLLARIMRIILLNAGANRGFLILASHAGPDFRIEAAASSEHDEVELHRKLPLSEAALASDIVHHVLRTGDDVVLEDAHRRGPFTADPHVQRRRLRSVLCTPIRHKDELVGVLYLENEHASAAFTQTRIEVLQILLSQAAISLENARYYDQLRARADELAESKARLEAEIAERERGQAERQQLEAQLRQAQKMEAIGQLAGGVAHDFNNLLTTIIGSTDVLATRMRNEQRWDAPANDRAGGPSPADEVRIIREAAERGAALTRQLLAFSRRQVLQPELVDLGALVERSAAILERLLGVEHPLRLQLGGDLGAVRVDPGQLEQVILNLVINARDAMQPGGRVWLSTRSECVDSPRPAVPQPIQPGPWVVLCVRDEGTGIDSATIAHIFEPFFTTKGVGHGTGLGLSTVLGIVSQSDGYITVDSQLGVGSTFEIWLPRMSETNDRTPLPASEPPEPEVQRGAATILVVEDEAPVRRTVEQILLLHGYTVLTAEDGEACLELCGRYQGPIDLVLTDFVMPRLGGLDLAAKLRLVQPQAKVLFMSGFTDGQLDPAKVAALGGVELIEKPFRAAALLARIRALLE